MRKEVRHIKNVFSVMKILQKDNLLNPEEYIFWITIIEEEGLKL